MSFCVNFKSHMSCMDEGLKRDGGKDERGTEEEREVPLSKQRETDRARRSRNRENRGSQITKEK